MKLAHTAAALVTSFVGAQAPCDPLHLQWVPDTIHVGETARLRVSGVPSTLGIVGVDVSAGPTTIPGFGVFHLGFTPAWLPLLVMLDATGTATFDIPSVCKEGVVNDYFAQGTTLTLAGSNCLSNTTAIYVHSLDGQCGPPDCILTASTPSEFNCSPICAGSHVWFNAVLRLYDMADGVCSFRNGLIQFSAGGTDYALRVPNAVVTVDPAATQVSTAYNPALFQFETTIPPNFTNYLFLTGLSFPVTTALPGGIDPVQWSGEFLTHEPGISFKWKWAAAVYTNFSTDYNALNLRPVNASVERAGTPRNFKTFVTSGGTGDGGCDYVGDYSVKKILDCPCPDD